MNLPRRHSGYTLFEMMMVITIIGIMAAIAVPALGHFKRADAMLAVTRQMLDDVGRARQLALSQRTTVYMVFCPSNFWNDPAYNSLPGPENIPGTEQFKAKSLYDKQLISYTFVTLRSVGDQPGRPTPRYLSPWQPLPDGTFIAPQKFGPRVPATPWLITDPATSRSIGIPGSGPGSGILGFEVTTNIPFPSEATAAVVPPVGPPYVSVPYIAFNSLGQLTSGQDEFIPLARGSVVRNVNLGYGAMSGPPDIQEAPAGNSTNSYNVIHIDALTGRARLEHREISGS